MIVGETNLFEGTQYWGSLRIHNRGRQSVLVQMQVGNSSRWVDVAEFTIIQGRLAYCIHKDGLPPGEVEGGQSPTGKSDRKIIIP